MKNMKKILALALVIVSVLAISVPALASTTTRYVTAPQGAGWTVNIRASQSLTSLVLDSPTHGSALYVTSSGSTWSAVTYYNPKTKVTSNGYMQNQFLSSSIPSDTVWLSEYGTVDHRYTDRIKPGCDHLQEDLNAYFRGEGKTSYSWYPLTADGICGNNTVNAIKEFQRLNNLSADGVAGNRTKEYLFKLVNMR